MDYDYGTVIYHGKTYYIPMNGKRDESLCGECLNTFMSSDEDFEENICDGFACYECLHNQRNTEVWQWSLMKYGRVVEEKSNGRSCIGDFIKSYNNNVLLNLLKEIRIVANSSEPKNTLKSKLLKSLIEFDKDVYEWSCRFDVVRRMIETEILNRLVSDRWVIKDEKKSETTKNKCPNCGSHNIKDYVQSHNNGVLGSGFVAIKSILFNYCGDCGVAFVIDDKK